MVLLKTSFSPSNPYSRAWGYVGASWPCPFDCMDDNGCCIPHFWQPGRSNRPEKALVCPEHVFFPHYWGLAGQSVWNAVGFLGVVSFFLTGSVEAYFPLISAMVAAMVPFPRSGLVFGVQGTLNGISGMFASFLAQILHGSLCFPIANQYSQFVYRVFDNSLFTSRINCLEIFQLPQGIQVCIFFRPLDQFRVQG